MKRRKRILAKFLLLVMTFCTLSQVQMQKVNAAQQVSIAYKSHVQTFGWENQWKSDGAVSGTSGKAKRLEGICIRVNGDDLGVRYTTHCQTYGWLPWVSDGEVSGTEGEAKRLEAIKIELTGANAGKYDVYYRVHAQTYGWLAWAKNGEAAGTAGFGKRLEAIQIRIVPAGTQVSNNWGNVVSQSGKSYVAANAAADANVEGQTMTSVMYRTHVQTYGWQGWKYNGNVSGTSGQAKRLEAINLKLVNRQYSGDIVYRTHVQTYGWQTWKKNGEMSGTSGEAKRLEAIQIYLTGEMAAKYDIYYRVHAQSFGWLDWVKNGEPSGTAGYAKRLEAIQIVLVTKNAGKPGTVGGVDSGKAVGFVNKPGTPMPDNPYNPSNNASGNNTNSQNEDEKVYLTDVTQYSYEIIPLLPPFNEYYYVKTDNPNPDSFIFYDEESKYNQSTMGNISTYYPYYRISACTRCYTDVQYEDKTTRRVKGGYIFYSLDSSVDGGKLTLKQGYRINNNPNIQYEDTSVTIDCPEVKNKFAYLVDAYASPDKDFFENLGSIQSGIQAVYPKFLLDTSEPNDQYPYPLLVLNPYEYFLDKSCRIYNLSDEKLLILEMYPYVLSSTGFPAFMGDMARYLNPNCKVENGGSHWSVEITLDGRSATYGGYGVGSNDQDVFDKYVEKLFLFDGSANDFAAQTTLPQMKEKLLAYGELSSEELQSYQALLQGDILAETIYPGNWMRVVNVYTKQKEPYVYCYTYWSGNKKQYSYLHGGWVDGRYVNGTFQRGATFAQYPNADIILTNQQVTILDNQTITCTIRYTYNSADDCWYAAENSFPSNVSDTEIAKYKVLTRNQVNAMRVDRNTNKTPESGLIYDGTAYPGTPF
ncbi:MAG: hypothetical protein ACI4L2_04850 [Wujia sp.]